MIMAPATNEDGFQVDIYELGCDAMSEPEPFASSILHYSLSPFSVKRSTHVRKRVTERLDALLDAQIDNALGISYMVTRDRNTGKFIRVGPAMASRANEETIQVWQKDPSVSAFTDLMNRAIDKPVEQPTQLEHAGKDSGPLEIIVRTPWREKGDKG